MKKGKLIITEIFLDHYRVDSNVNGKIQCVGFICSDADKTQWWSWTDGSSEWLGPYSTQKSAVDSLGCS